MSPCFLSSECRDIACPSSSYKRFVPGRKSSDMARKGRLCVVSQMNLEDEDGNLDA